MYRWVLVLDGQPVQVSVVQQGSPLSPKLKVTISTANVERTAKSEVAATLEHVLGTQVDLKTFYRFASRDPRLGSLVKKFRGVKPPRFPTVFEALVNAITCQQLSLTIGIYTFC